MEWKQTQFSKWSTNLVTGFKRSSMGSPQLIFSPEGHKSKNIFFIVSTTVKFVLCIEYYAVGSHCVAPKLSHHDATCTQPIGLFKILNWIFNLSYQWIKCRIYSLYWRGTFLFNYQNQLHHLWDTVWCSYSRGNTIQAAWKKSQELPATHLLIINFKSEFPGQAFFPVDMLTYHSRKSTGDINDGSVLLESQ